jgi:N-acetylmuramoyl-L-alanine amidase
VLNETHSPSVLVEAGFLSNPQEAANLATRAYQEKLAAAIAGGIAEYLRDN